MSRIFIVPDVHLKPWIFEEASEMISKGDYDAVVMLGDLVDDWYQEKNIDLYNETFDAAIAFVTKHRDTFWCYGNHDVSYLWGATESGYSFYARDTVVERTGELRKALPPENCAFIHRIDDVLFSHAGLTESFVSGNFGDEEQNLDTILGKINEMGKNELWQDDSPIWARPQYGEMKLYPEGILQVVGHTPVVKPLYEKDLITLDNFSTYRNGTPIGDEQFVWIDTVEKKAYPAE